ncbi:MAG: site-specific integrase [Planctomycetota bacterium]|jgi:site-specific recombinase XerD
MLESIVKRPDKLKLARTCSLRNHINHYLTHLSSLGYKKITIRNYARILLNFAGFVDKQKQCNIRNLSDWIEPFLQPVKKLYYRRYKRNTIRPFVRFLQKEGFVSEPIVEKSSPPFWDIACEYKTFLREQRNLANKTIGYSIFYCLKFLQHIHDLGIEDISLLQYDTVQKFILMETQYYSRVSIKSNTGTIRQFLAYLKSRGKIKKDFSKSIIAPRIYQHERCPKYLTAKEIQEILSSIDRRTKIGKRDYAILLLLATYGLRSKEAAQLKLEDVGWRQDKINIRGRKVGNNSVYPLTPSVGEALLSYLKKARPPSSHRKIFLTSVAPYKPICRGVIWHQVRKYLRLAGLDDERASTHTFRYSCAQRLFDDEFPVKVISDYLGHRCLNSTQRYMKIDIKHLRQIAVDSLEDIL